MKFKDWLIAFTLTLIVVLLYKYNTLALDNQHQINQLKQPQQVIKVVPVQVDKALVDRLEKLAREKLEEEWENAALIDQLEAYGGWWKEVEKNDFPKEGEK